VGVDKAIHEAAAGAQMMANKAINEAAASAQMMADKAINKVVAAGPRGSCRGCCAASAMGGNNNQIETTREKGAGGREA
jgi:hypothetical protein